MGLNEFKPLLFVLKVNSSTPVKMLIAVVRNTYVPTAVPQTDDFYVRTYIKLRLPL